MTLTRQIKRFIITGAINTVFGYLVYAACVTLFDMSYFSSVVISYIVGVTFSYTTFRTFVFTTGERGWQSYARFIPTYIVLLIINILALYVLVDIAGWHKLVAKAVIVPCCAAISFIMNRIFVFKGKE